ncbi:steroid 17-alpha-hydroxylase/17,20 lyase-like [Saccoglossus kowalevskii]
MLNYPEIQGRVAKEIVDVIGYERTPRLSDRGSLPYCEAVINEVMRIQTVAPLAIPHQACVDSSIGGYRIPKDTLVMVNLWALHNDVKEWDNPREFNPGRFIDTESGQFEPRPSQSYMPFSAGRRMCIGESLAKAQIFLLFVSLFQNFEFTAAPEQGAPRLDGFCSIFVNHPFPYKACAKKRLIRSV